MFLGVIDVMEKIKMASESDASGSNPGGYDLSK
jgi:hypothetical protein